MSKEPPASQGATGLRRIALTAVAASIAETCTYPIDMVKTRLQLQGEHSTMTASSSQTTHPASTQAASTQPASLQHQANSLQGPQPTTTATPKTAATPKAAAPHAKQLPHVSSTTAPAASASRQRPLGAICMAANIVRHEGVVGLYKGLAPAALRHVFYSGTRITVYEQLREWVANNQLNNIKAAHTGVGTSLLLGLTAGAVGQAVAVPADLIKVRMQADGRLVAAGLLPKPRYKGIIDAVQQISAAEGGLGLWRGALPAIQRAALVNLGELATYDSAKQALLHNGGFHEGPTVSGLASLCSGFVAAVVSTPADVIKTRMMNKDPTRQQYRGSMDCLIQSVRAEGFWALYKGFLPTWARLGPWQLVFWTSYEQLRRAIGMTAF